MFDFRAKKKLQIIDKQTTNRQTNKETKPTHTHTHTQLYTTIHIYGELYHKKMGCVLLGLPHTTHFSMHKNMLGTQSIHHTHHIP